MKIHLSGTQVNNLRDIFHFPSLLPPYAHPKYRQSLLTLLLKYIQNPTLLTTSTPFTILQATLISRLGYGTSFLTSFPFPPMVYSQPCSQREVYIYPIMLNSPMSPHLTQCKNQNLHRIRPFRILSNYLSNLISSYSRPSSASATTASLLLQKRARHTSAPGSMLLLFRLSRILFHLIYPRFTPLPPLGMCSRVPLPAKSSLNTLLKSATPSPESLIYLLHFCT